MRKPFIFLNNKKFKKGQAQFCRCPQFTVFWSCVVKWQHLHNWKTKSKWTETTHVTIWQSLIFLMLKCSEIDHSRSLFDWIFGGPRLNLPELEKDCPITTISEKKIINQFLGKRRNTVHRFEGCFLRGQVRSNGFKVFNGCKAEL